MEVYCDLIFWMHRQSFDTRNSTTFTFTRAWFNMAPQFPRTATLAAIALSAVGAYGQALNILSFVDPLIGTSNGGHVFPGATLPFGMAKAGCDVDIENQGGFSSFPDGVPAEAQPYITGFSHMHDSGTGGVSITWSEISNFARMRRFNLFLTTSLSWFA